MHYLCTFYIVLIYLKKKKKNLHVITAVDCIYNYTVYLPLYHNPSLNLHPHQQTCPTRTHIQLDNSTSVLQYKMNTIIVVVKDT